MQKIIENNLSFVHFSRFSSELLAAIINWADPYIPRDHIRRMPVKLISVLSTGSTLVGAASGLIT